MILRLGWRHFYLGAPRWAVAVAVFVAVALVLSIGFGTGYFGKSKEIKKKDESSSPPPGDTAPPTGTQPPPDEPPGTDGETGGDTGGDTGGGSSSETEEVRPQYYFMGAIGLFQFVTAVAIIAYYLKYPSHSNAENPWYLSLGFTTFVLTFVVFMACIAIDFLDRENADDFLTWIYGIVALVSVLNMGWCLYTFSEGYQNKRGYYEYIEDSSNLILEYSNQYLTDENMDKARGYLQSVTDGLNTVSQYWTAVSDNSVTQAAGKTKETLAGIYDGFSEMVSSQASAADLAGYIWNQSATANKSLLELSQGVQDTVKKQLEVEINASGPDNIPSLASPDPQVDIDKLVASVPNWRDELLNLAQTKKTGAEGYGFFRPSEWRKEFDQEAQKLLEKYSSALSEEFEAPSERASRARALIDFKKKNPDLFGEK